MNSILIVDDHQLIRDVIKYYFKEDKDFFVAAEASNGHEALELLIDNTCDVIIGDFSMPKMDSIELMAKIRMNYPDMKVLVLSMHRDASAINKMISLGAHGYILKNTSRSDLKLALNQIIKGENYFSKDVYDVIFSRIVKKKDSKKRLTLETELSRREKEVLQLIVKEQTNQQIADKLFIKIRTVETYKRNLLERTGCKNVAGLVIYAIERDLA